MKNIIFTFIVLALISYINYAQENEPERHNLEVAVYNYTNLVFTGGTMLRLCWGLARYSVDFDFWVTGSFDFR